METPDTLASLLNRAKIKPTSTPSRLILEVSPPKAPILECIQSIDRARSCIPRFSLFSSPGNPRAPRRC